MCLNFLVDGRCIVNDRECVLGARGAVAKNENRECELHGDFDLWVLHDRSLLVTDLGIPAEEPAQCLALGVTETVAMNIASKKSELTAQIIRTSKRKCMRCGSLYWMSEHIRSGRLMQYGYATFCLKCFGSVDSAQMVGKMGEQRYWCG